MVYKRRQPNWHAQMAAMAKGWQLAAAERVADRSEGRRKCTLMVRGGESMHAHGMATHGRALR